MTSSIRLWRSNLLLGLFLTALGLLVSPTSSFGQASIGASPAEMHFVVKAGQAQSETLKIDNGGRAPFRVKIYAQDWWREGGKSRYGEIGTKPKYSAAGWLTFSPNEVVIEPGKRTSIKVTASPPPGKKGSYSAVIFAQMAPAVTTDAGKAVFLGGRLGIASTVSIAGTAKPEADLSGLWIEQPSAYEPGRIIFKIKNKGNAFLSPRGTVIIMDQSNPQKPKLAARTEFEGKLTFPDATQEFETVFSGNLKRGKRYHAIVTMNLNDRVQLSEKQVITCEADVVIQARNSRRGQSSKVVCR